MFFGNDLRNKKMQREFYISMNDVSINVLLDSLAQSETDTCKNQKDVVLRWHCLSKWLPHRWNHVEDESVMLSTEECCVDS